MPIAKEFTIRQEDRPGTLGKLCQALAEQSVNILAFQSCPLEKGKSAVRLVVDNPAVAKSILDRQKTDYSETEVAKVAEPGFCTRFTERVYITANGCEFCFGTHGLQAAGAGGL